MSNSDPSNKVLAMHLERCAYVYVRQSSYYQVEHNLESQRRQYNMRTWALELGWPEERIVVVDEDQGISGAVAGMRSGFEQLASAVGREEVGIVLSLEASRLARNSPDWHHLIYVCRWTQTLLGDEHGIYDPADSNDRMVLGIRGQMSEMELEMSIHRMVEGRNIKALRGELMTIPPAGYEVDEQEQLVMTSDEKVQHAIRTVFSKFDEHQSKGVFYRPQLDWPNIFSHAIDLSKDHSKTIGARSLDILHVASALSIKTERFLTLDERQSELASLAGLKIEKINHKLP